MTINLPKTCAYCIRSLEILISGKNLLGSITTYEASVKTCVGFATPRMASTFIERSVAAPPISAGEKARALLRRVGRSDNPDCPPDPCDREDNDCDNGSCCCCCCCAFLVKVVLAGGALLLLKADAPLVENRLRIPGRRKIIMAREKGVCLYR